VNRYSYQPRNNLVKDENGDLLAESRNILNRWKNYFSQLFNVHNVSDVMQIEIHVAGPSLLGSSRLEVEIALAKLKKYKSAGSNRIPSELIQAGGEMLLSAIHKLVNSIWNKEELPDQFTKRATKLTVIIIMGYHCYQHHATFYELFFSQG
jgi:hypothetical protein